VLCEAATPQQLEQTQLIDSIRRTLEAISPRGIRRVNVNSRIVREQQLLWLEEISRDPDELLWCQEISLKRPNFVRAWLDDRRDAAAAKAEYSKPLSRQDTREKQQFTKGLLGGLGLSAVLLLGGWAVYAWQTGRNADASAPIKALLPQSDAAAAKPNTDQDSFSAAVRLAERAAQEGQTANTAQQWRDIAALWGQASDRMAEVSPAFKQYSVAQDRTVAYRRNQQNALEKGK
jgi:hypothetical protein